MNDEPRPQRVRDPVHGLITFRTDLDRLAWTLIDTPEFQRLRRIRQLGVSESVFPSAVHTRFAHSIGVFHTARSLVAIIRREIGEDFEQKRADVAVIAALLHDLGHGPFSHTFEEVQRSRSSTKRHEAWTADIIFNPGGCIRPLLDSYQPGQNFCESVAKLMQEEDPDDIYHAIVSSSFDADRLDYLRRDRLMTGTGAGAIDFDWLMEHIRVRTVAVDAADADSVDNDMRLKVSTFCIDAKALPAAEQFLLARYTLHEQVYFHKTTRCIQAMIGQVLRRVAELSQDRSTVTRLTGLEENHPLVSFFGTDQPSIAHYLALDDIVITSSLERMGRAEDVLLANLSQRLRERRLYKTLDLRSFSYDDEGRQQTFARRIDKMIAKGQFAGTVLKDEDATIGIYTQIGGDDDKIHRKLHILEARGPREITDLSPLVRNLAQKKRFIRYYFEHEADRDMARGLGRGRHDRS